MIHIDTAHKKQWTDALARAKKERVRLWHTEQGWRARSAKSTQTYTLLAVAIDGEMTILCSCPATSYMGYCKHAIRLAERLSKRGLLIRLR
jgi:hypothetical protein